VQVGPDATTGEWTIAGHAISVAMIRSGAVTDVYATYDGAQLPKMTIQADYDVARQGIQAIKTRVLQAMSLGPLEASS
jgi:hypothetical protein